MSKQDDGGPRAHMLDIDLIRDRGDGRISLRDWFAGMALQGELAAQDVRNDGRGTGVLNAAELDSHAKWCYLIADAMLRARAVDGGGR